MPDILYGGLHEQKFRSMAKKSVVEYWNSNSKLVDKYGEISERKVYVVWQVKVIQNSKAMLGVFVKGDGLYFEFTYNGDENVGYLDVYHKRKHIEIEY